MTKKAQRKPKPGKTQRYTLEDAFNYFSVPTGAESNENEFQSERCARAVAFLLHYGSEYGNEPMDGSSATGLACILEKCAGNISKAVPRREYLLRTGGAK